MTDSTVNGIEHCPLSKNLNDIVSDFVEAAAYCMRGVYQPNCCIAACRIAHEVLESHGFRVRPLTVEVGIFNPIFRAKNRMPSSTEEADVWLREGAWMIHMGERTHVPNSGKWPGHLLAILNGVAGLDLTLGQASRPQKGIHLDAAGFAACDRFLSGEDTAMVEMNGCLIVYHAHPKDKTFAQSPDWQNKGRRHDQVIERIKTRMRRQRDHRGV